MTRAPAWPSILRRFMAGESQQIIANWMAPCRCNKLLGRRRPWHQHLRFPPLTMKEVEDALRRGMLATERKRRSK